MNISFWESDFDIAFIEAYVDFVVELALHAGRAFVCSKLGNSSTYFCQISA